MREKERGGEIEFKHATDSNITVEMNAGLNIEGQLFVAVNRKK